MDWIRLSKEYYNEHFSSIKCKKYPWICYLLKKDGVI